MDYQGHLADLRELSLHLEDEYATVVSVAHDTIEHLLHVIDMKQRTIDELGGRKHGETGWKK